MNDILKKYDKLREYEPPLLKCGDTVVPATDELPGFLQAAILLAENISAVKGTKRAKTAFGDVAKWISHLESMQASGHEVMHELKGWAGIANLLNNAASA